MIGFAACAGGDPRWWFSDGPLVPVGYFKELRRLCADVARDEPHFAAWAHHGRGTTPALPARARRLPAIAIGCLDGLGVAPRSHQGADTPAAIDPEAIDQIVQFGLLLVDAIDEFIAGRTAARPAPAAA